MKIILFLVLLVLIVGCTTTTQTDGYYSPLSTADIAKYNLSFFECVDVYCTYLGDGFELSVGVQSFENISNAKGYYDYSSSHLIRSQWVVSEDDIGDMSKFLAWNESETWYYHYWIVDELRAIHVTSSGTQDAQSVVRNIGEDLIS